MAPRSPYSSGSVVLIAVAARRMQSKLPIRLMAMTRLNAVEVGRRLVLAVLADGALGPADAGRVHEHAHRTDRLGHLDGVR